MSPVKQLIKCWVVLSFMKHAFFLTPHLFYGESWSGASHYWFPSLPNAGRTRFIPKLSFQFNASFTRQDLCNRDGGDCAMSNVYFRLWFVHWKSLALFPILFTAQRVSFFIPFDWAIFQTTELRLKVDFFKSCWNQKKIENAGKNCKMLWKIRWYWLSE